MVYPLYTTFISVFGIFSIVFLLSGWWVVRRKKSTTSS
jgi:LPXTG-motif cell wall-anchored protein